MIKKHQWIVVTSLNLVILFLIGGLVFISVMKKKPAVVPPVDPTENYQRVRDAEISLSPNLAFEQYVGGSADETPVAAFKVDETIYIFGNTTSTDYDMSGITRGFLAIITAAGRTVDFIALSNDELTCGSIAEGGFLICSISEAMLIDYNGKKQSSYRFPAGDRPKKVILSDDGYIIAAENSSSGSFGKLRITRLSQRLQLVYASISDEIYNLSLLDLYCMGENTIVFCNSNGVKSMLSAGVFTAGAAPVFTHIPLDDSYTAYGVSPCDGGYTALAVDSLGRAFMLKINYRFALLRKLSFNIGDCIDGTMVFHNGSFTVFVRRNMVNFCATVDFAVTKTEVSSEAINYLLTCSGNTLRALSFENGVKLGIIEGSNITAISLSDAKAYGGLLCEGYLILEADGKMGGRDIVIFKLL